MLCHTCCYLSFYFSDSLVGISYLLLPFHLFQRSLGCYVILPATFLSAFPCLFCHTCYYLSIYFSVPWLLCHTCCYLSFYFSGPLVVMSYLLLPFLLCQRSLKLGCYVILAATFPSISAFPCLFCHTCCYLSIYFSVPLVVISYLLLPFHLFQRSLGCYVILAATFPSISAFPWLLCHTCCCLSIYFSVPLVVMSYLLLPFHLFQRSLGCYVILAATFPSISASPRLFCHTCCYLSIYFSVPLVVMSYLLLPFLLFQRSLSCYVILAAAFPSISAFPWLLCHTCCYLSIYFSFPLVVMSYLLLPFHLFQRSLGCYVLLAAAFPSILAFPWLICHTCCYLSIFFSFPFVVMSYLLLPFHLFQRSLGWFVIHAAIFPSISAFPWLIIPAFGLLSVAGLVILVTNLQIANLFGERRYTVMATLIGAFHSSSVILACMKVRRIL